MAKKDRRLIMVLKDKGGTGGSTFCKVLWQRMLWHNMDARAFDADGSTGSFMLQYGEYDDEGSVVRPQPPTGVTPLRIHGNDNDRDALTDALLDAKADRLLVDFPAIGLDALARIEAERSFTKDAQGEGYAVTIVTVCSPYPESLINVGKALDAFPNVDHVVALNAGLGDIPDDYVLWFGSEEESLKPANAKRRLDELGDRGAQIVFPRIKTAPLVLCARHNLSFGDAPSSELIKSRAKRSLIREWLEQSFDAMGPADHLLGFPTRSASRNGGPQADALS